jgi:carbamoyl-phosphate synthase large subunit
MEEAEHAGKELGFPLVIRPAYTLGGTGGGFANNWDELKSITQSGLTASRINQVLLERSLVGWKEIEYEVIRDRVDNCIMVCNMENIDPMGVHTGDSIVVAPSQTLTDKEYQILRSSSLKIVRALGIEGGCNVQFALAPSTEVANSISGDWKPDSQYYVIEVNPRVSRSSALASKATGYPIARVAAKIAIGKCLNEIPNAITKNTTAAFEPALDYCVVKIPRWPFDKFPTGDRTTGTQMKATGEVMAIDRSFEAALQKAVRSLEIGPLSLTWENRDWGKPTKSIENYPLHSNDERLWALMSVLRAGNTVENISSHTGIDPWFIRALSRIVHMEQRLLSETLTKELLWEAKRLGMSDNQIASITDDLPEQIRSLRKQMGIIPVYKMVDTCAAEFEAETPYFYSTYEEENEATPLKGNRAIVIGSGPIRIGQGIEFDYCSVHAAWALEQDGIKSIMVNSNPETVSTDFDTSTRLYFEPLDEESIRDIIENECIDSANLENRYPASVVQFGGQTAINISQQIDKADLPILGSSAKAIDTASDRRLFENFLNSLGIPQPPGATVTSVEEALTVADNLEYPLLVRPSYVLGGRAMEIVETPTELIKYISTAVDFDNGKPILLDKYLLGREVEVDAVCDGEQVLIPGVMEHVERAGVHSGDSMAVYPGLTLTNKEVEDIVKYTTKIGLALEMKGLMNIQYVIVGGNPYRSPNTPHNNKAGSTVYVLEVNPRASRTIPFISKVTGVPMVRIATRVMLGKSIDDQGYSGGLFKKQNLVAVKAPIFSMSKLIGVETYLGPEMKSTGEVMGIDYDFESAIAKALLSGGLMLPPKGSILLSIADKDKAESLSLVKDLDRVGYKIFATEGTAAIINALGVKATIIEKKLGEGHPNVVDIISNGTVDAVVNTVSGARKPLRDGFEIRQAATQRKIPCFTSLDTARSAIESLVGGGANYNVKRLTEYLSNGK